MREPVEEAGGELVAGAGGVDDAVDRVRVDHVHLVAATITAPFSLRVERGDLAVVLHALERVVELVDLVERA